MAPIRPSAVVRSLDDGGFAMNLGKVLVEFQCEGVWHPYRGAGCFANVVRGCRPGTASTPGYLLGPLRGRVQRMMWDGECCEITDERY